MRVPLGVLDQSPVISGHSATEAIAETVSLARLAEELGYGRYWLAEHHAIAALADPSPEILVSRVASATSRIRVGTGGVLLPYYSPLKIAEQFRMLEALFPGRIDLGIGRPPGRARCAGPRPARGRCRDRCARGKALRACGTARRSSAGCNRAGALHPYRRGCARWR